MFALYLSPNSCHHKKLFDYLTSKVELLSLFLFPEMSILGDINVHQQLWLPFLLLTILPFNFVVLIDLQQLVLHSTHILNHPSDYVITLPSLGFSDVSVSGLVTSIPSQSGEVEVLLACCLWEFGELGRCYVDFSWDDYWFHVIYPSLC